jgi:hypothetical protein
MHEMLSNRGHNVVLIPLMCPRTLNVPGIGQESATGGYGSLPSKQKL